jgi:hypothetical protein
MACSVIRGLSYVLKMYLCVTSVLQVMDGHSNGPSYVLRAVITHSVTCEFRKFLYHTVFSK